MLTLPGYIITDELYANGDTLVCHGLRASDQQSVILKTVSQGNPSLKQIARASYEYDLMRELSMEGVLRVHALDYCDGRPVLVFEHFDGEPLDAVIAGQRLDLETALRVTIAIADALSALHAQQIIHKDIKPANILLNRQSRQIKLIDFGIATRLSQESQRAAGAHLAEGTLAYSSPEQTGRMNRVVDHRADFYALGVTLYELLTGTLPFTSTDPMELLHSHIARRPLAPHEVAPGVPHPISEIVMKLLAKNAEERYQHGAGLKADLETCLEQLEATGTVAPFPLGRHDHGETLHISQRLYGREQELQQLTAAFERVSAGASALLMVSGYSGVGKSALVNEIQKPVVRQHGYFVAGKCDQYQRTSPYAAIIQACQELMRQVLTESEGQIARWREQLLGALGDQAQVLIDVVPALERLLGAQPPVLQLGPTEAQHRFTTMFQHFIGVFATAEHPLVLFLDDLQWIDIASLRLIQTLVSAGGGHLLLIGAYRDNEVGPAHPLTAILDELRAGAAAPTELVLQPLQLQHVRQLLADSLSSDGPAVAPLAELVYRKTGGNPFFMSQFLKDLHRQGALFFDAGASAWSWDVEQVRRAASTENVVEFMAGRIRDLAPQAQRVVQLAACIGSQFDLRVLAVIYERSLVETATDIWEALREGLIQPLDDNYKVLLTGDQALASQLTDTDLPIGYMFLHDRVQQAAYSLIPDAQKQALHLRIGRLLRDQSDEAARQEQLFAIVNQLNVGAELIDDAAERLELARLNLAAGRKARAAVAFAAAAGYFAQGQALLDETAWQTHYDLMLALFKERAECEYLIGNTDAAEALFDTIIARARENVDKAEIYTMRVVLYTSMGRYLEGVEAGLHGLRLLGIAFPDDEAERQAAIGAAFAQARANLGERQVQDLLHAPLLSDPAEQTAIRLLGTLFPLAFNVSPSLLTLLTLAAVNISLASGNTLETDQVYGTYGMMLAAAGDGPAAYAYGVLALQLNEKFNNLAQRHKLYQIFGSFINPWGKHIGAGLTYLRQGYLDSVALGDMPQAGFLALSSVVLQLWKGDRLDEVSAEIRKYIAFMSGNAALAGLLTLFQQTILNLQGRTPSPHSLSSDGFDEESYLAILQAHNLINSLNFYYLYKAQALYIHGEHRLALELISAAEQTSFANAGTWNIHELVYYQALIIAALHPDAQAAERAGQWEKLAANQRQLALWAEQTPNARPTSLLVAAEIARLAGRDLEAMETYDAAIASARELGFTQHMAIASELAARYYQGRGRTHIATLYMGEAYAAYEGWGASGKTRALVGAYPALASAEQQPGAGKRPTTATATTQGLAELVDVGAVVKVARVLTGEMILDRLLEKLMRIVLEHAGAQKGALVLARNGQLVVEAVSTVDLDVTTTRPAIALAASDDLAVQMIQFAARMQEPVVLEDATRQHSFSDDPYLRARQPRSVLVLPLVHQGQLSGVLYLEHGLLANVFTPDRLELIGLIALQGAIAIENALLYERAQAMGADLQRSNERLAEANRTLEATVAERTAELHRANEQLQQELYERQRAEEERARLQNEVIQIQASALLELSTPLIPITDQIMVMPLIGAMDSQRAQHILSTLLHGVNTSQARLVLIDITGVSVVDTAVASTLINAAQSVRLLGAQTLLTGIRPEVAQTLIGLGVDLAGIVTMGTLQRGIEYAMAATARGQAGRRN